MYLFPLIGGFIGVLAASYFFGCKLHRQFLLSEINNLHCVTNRSLFRRLVVAAMIVAFLMVITGLQHFDGIIDLGNTFGLRNIQDRKTLLTHGQSPIGEHYSR